MGKQQGSPSLGSLVEEVRARWKWDEWGGLSMAERYRLQGAVATLAALGCVVGVVGVWRMGWCRFRTAEDIPQGWIRRQATLRGRVVRVGDGDNFRMIHLPWIRRWVHRGSNSSLVRSANAEQSIHIRLAGVDAPECSHFGLAGQPFGPDARRWLHDFLDKRWVSVVLHERDQYRRIVGTAYVRPRGGIFRQNVSVALVRAGYAVVFRGPQAQYGGALRALEVAERQAKRRAIGMWVRGPESVENPQTFKRHAKLARSRQRTEPELLSLGDFIRRFVVKVVNDIYGPFK
mmetsp:Transcript_619/g.1256  ORF Transcript_619/g.1256 Transcript_619/m.1256 type:complete len:289 (-) Transcript_619:3116-3982(-)